MNKKSIALCILLIGITLTIYGFVFAPINNESVIRANYDCERGTLESRPTDMFCVDPGSAPIAQKDFLNIPLYFGVAITVLSGVYIMSLSRQKNS